MTTTHEPLSFEGTLELDDHELIRRAQQLAGSTAPFPVPSPEAGIVALLATARAKLELLLGQVEDMGPCCHSCTATADLPTQRRCAQEFGVIEFRLAEIICVMRTDITFELWRARPIP